MASSQQSNTANDSEGKRQHGRPDERTPLLEGRNNIRAKGYLVASSDAAAVRADEEAAKCEIPLTNEAPREPILRNVAGVISVLLIGTCLVFSSVKIQNFLVH
jgi:hypothetical protein